CRSLVTGCLRPELAPQLDPGTNLALKLGPGAWQRRAAQRVGRHQPRGWGLAARPLGLPTMVTIRSWPSNKRLAARLASASVTASISALRRSTEPASGPPPQNPRSRVANLELPPEGAGEGAGREGFGTAQRLSGGPCAAGAPHP